MYRRFAEGPGWTPRQVAQDLPIVQLVALWGQDEQWHEEGEDEGGQAEVASTSREQQLAMINALRARQGKPPLEPVGWTPQGQEGG